MLLQGTINLLTAPPGGFKTWLSLSMGGAVSTGSGSIGFKTKRRRVLLLDRENPPHVINERSQVLNLNSHWFHVWGHWMAQDTPEIGDPTLIDFARHYQPLIIFDSFVRFHHADENSAKHMAKVLAELRVIADTGSTILLLHHLPKTSKSQYRGSTDILAGVDAPFELRKVKSKHGNVILSLKCFKHRLIEETETTIRLNLQEGRFEVVSDSSDAISTDVLEKIKAVIAEKPGITQKRLMEKASLPETNGRRILRQGDGTYWHSQRGEGSTLHYFPST